MRGIWLRRLIPAAVVSVVLAFSYLAPAEGMFAPPVKTADHPNCGRNGYGYHGGKHNFACPSPPSQGVITSSALPHAVVGSPAATQPPVGPATNSPATQPAQDSTTPRPATAGPVAVDVTPWRSFAEFLLRQLSPR